MQRKNAVSLERMEKQDYETAIKVDVYVVTAVT